MKLSVVIPATDGPPTLERCLAAIAATDAAPEEVIVVDDPGIRGPAAARNEGVARSNGDVIVFVDSDVVVHPDAFVRIRSAFERDTGLVALFGSYDDRIETVGLVAGFRNLLHHCVHQRYPGEAETFWAGLGAVRRRMLLDVGGFDAARYPSPSIEDVELGGRLAERGRIVLDACLLGTHLKEWTLPSMVRTDLVGRGVPWVRLMLDRRRVPVALNLGHRERASTVAALTTCWAALRGRPVLLGASVAAQIVLNRDLHTLVARRLGARGATAGVALHTLHQLTAVASVPVGIAAHLIERTRAR
jgi:hypothetical protein